MARGTQKIASMKGNGNGENALRPEIKTFRAGPSASSLQIT